MDHDRFAQKPLIEVIEEDGGNVYMLRGQAAGDYADGKALRKLQEALPEGVTIDIQIGAHPYITPVAMLVTYGADAYSSRFWGGDTISEAADKCREALEGR